MPPPPAPSPAPEPAASAVPTVTERYWAAARAAAGTGSEQVPGDTVAAVLAECIARHPGLAQVVTVATFLLDGHAVPRATALVDGAVVEVLPPFAGG